MAARPPLPGSVAQVGATLSAVSRPMQPVPTAYALRELIPGWDFYEEQQDKGYQIVRAYCVNCKTSRTVKIHGVDAVDLTDVRAWNSVVAADLRTWHDCWMKPVTGIFESIPGWTFKKLDPVMITAECDQCKFTCGVAVSGTLVTEMDEIRLKAGAVQVYLAFTHRIDHADHADDKQPVEQASEVEAEAKLTLANLILDVRNDDA